MPSDHVPSEVLNARYQWTWAYPSKQKPLGPALGLLWAGSRQLVEIMVEIDPFIILEEEEHENGDIILREGASTDWIYIILEGRVRIQKNTPKGTVAITTLGEGRFVGEMAFLEKGKVPRAASAVALGYVRLGVLDQDRLTKEYDSLSPLFRKLILTLVRRLRYITDIAVNLVSQQKP